MQLKGKRDASFLRAAFRLLRDEYGIRPCLSTDQFLEEVRNVSRKLQGKRQVQHRQASNPPELGNGCFITFTG